jgi:2-haloalkanoic acid dehalogenase type II
MLRAEQAAMVCSGNELMLDLADFNTLTFDCYGTLIDWERGILDELQPWLARNGLAQLGDDTILETFAPFEAACEAEMPTAPYPAILEEVHNRLSHHWHLEPVGELARAFGQSVGKWPAFPDTPAALQYLKRHYKLVIISNVDRASFARTNQRLGVAFDLIVTAQDVGSYKPNIRNFEHALAALYGSLGTQKNDVLHVACSIFHDIVPAKSIGLKTVWIDRRRATGGSFGLSPNAGDEEAARRPDLAVRSMAEFVAWHKSRQGAVR